MKILLNILALLILASACKKRAVKPPNHGEVSYYQNGQLIEDINITNLDFHLLYNNDGSKIDFGFIKYKLQKDPIQDFYYWDQRFNFYGIPKIIGKSYLNYYSGNINDSLVGPAIVYYTYQEHGEMECEVYSVNVDDAANNYIEITKEKNNFNEIWGTFQLSLVKISSCPVRNNPDNIKIEKGEFYLKVK